MQTNNKKDTFTLWGVQDRETGTVFETCRTRNEARASATFIHPTELCRVVKLSCQIVPQKRKNSINPELK